MPSASPAADAADPQPTIDPSAPPDVAALLAKVRAAEGKRPHAERLVERVTRPDASDTVTTVRLGKDFRTTYDDGPYLTAYGEADGQRWHQNANGLTVLDQPRAGREADERTTMRLTHVTAPIAADVISDLDAKGFGERTYVDPATDRVVRRETISPNEIEVTTYDDFRTVDGITRAWRMRSTNGIAIDASETRVVSLATTGVTPQDVAIAPPRRALVAFPPGITSVSLPVRMDSQQHFLVRITMQGRGYDFIVDTGAAGIAVDEATARALGIALNNGYSSAANAGRYVEREAIVPEMHVGALTMKDVAVGVIPHLSYEDPDVNARAVGLLGFDFIASLALKFDYEHHALTAIDYDAFKPPAGANVVALPIRLGGQGPEIDVGIDGKVGEHFEIDTGDSGGLLITDLFTRRYPRITDGFVRRDETVTMLGVGGSYIAPLYYVPHVRIGSIDFEHFTAVVLDSARLYAFGGFDGVVGPNVLQYFDVTTDYADSTIYLTPNGRSDIRSSF